jgi:hypothetical protein
MLMIFGMEKAPFCFTMQVHRESMNAPCVQSAVLSQSRQSRPSNGNSIGSTSNPGMSKLIAWGIDSGGGSRTWSRMRWTTLARRRQRT